MAQWLKITGLNHSYVCCCGSSASVPSAVIQEILTKLETIEKHQLLILRHLQKCSPEQQQQQQQQQQSAEVPDVDLPVPVTSQGQLSRVEEAIVLQPDLKRKLVLATHP